VASSPPSQPRRPHARAAPVPALPPAPPLPSVGFGGDDPRFLLSLYNAAVCGIMDRQQYVTCGQYTWF
jgi:hypothetical protein